MRAIYVSSLLGTMALALILSACAGGQNQTGQVPPIELSIGNWAMTATDSSNNKMVLAAILSETGGTVAAINVSAVGSPEPPFACVTFNGSFSNGTVANGNDLTGSFAFTNASTGAVYGTVQVSAILAADGLSFTGTYSGMPSCSGLAASGTFAGKQVPSMTGAWTGSLQPCTYDQQTGTCTLTGVPGTITASLAQDNTTGTVSGTYQVPNVSGFLQGTIAMVPPFDFLAGQSLLFTMTDLNGATYKAVGGPCCNVGAPGLGFDRSLQVIVTASPGTNWYLSMTH